MGLRSATSLSHRRYSSRSRSRTANISDDEDSDGKENDIMRTAPAGLRSYRHTYITPQEPERDSVHLSLMKKERERERERGRDIITGRSMTSLSKYTAMSTPVHVHQTGSSSSVVSGNLPQQGAASYSSRRGSTQIMSNHTGNTAGGDSERAASRLSALVPIERTEHARLMADSFSMFEGHMARMLSSEGSALNSVYISELVRAAQGVVSSADRLNALLRSASKNAVDMEIDAEVADDIEAETGGRGNAGMYSAKDMVHVWKRVNADYKDGVKASDELVRGITSFLLGIGKVLRDVGSDGASVASSASVASTSSHMRSVSLNDEDIIRSSPSLSGSSGAGRRSVDIGRRTWETSPHVTAVAAAAAENPREEAYRRLTMMRPSSSSRPRERDQDVRYESPLTAYPSQHEFVTPASSKSLRRLLMPREQREQEREERLSRMSSSEDLVASTSQDTIVPCDPSPSPAPRIRDSYHKPLPPLSIPKALPSLPSATSSRQQNRSPEQDYNDLLEEASGRGHERRKASNASLSTIRAASIHSSYSTYPAVLNPSGGGATTAVTAHTVSNSTPESTPSISSSSVLSSAESRRNLRSIITFSRPSTESVPTLAGLQQQYEERQRSTTNEVRTSVPPPSSTPMSGSETERPPKRQTWGARTGQLARGMSMADAGSVDDFGRMSLGRAADRSAASSFSTRKERRTVTELFQRS
ncbi:hypothetical protein F5887DRAFT_501506 [Amanita rubescens]|nr:hypothetical protein F5887DRAFT_501506 [Amanita rubescens]